MSLEETTWEEAAHFAAASLQDLPVTELATGLIRRSPGSNFWTEHGWCRIVCNETRQDRLKLVRARLAPSVFTGAAPQYPPRPHAPTGDESDLAADVAALDLDERAYKRLVAETQELVARPAFRRLTFATFHAAMRFGPVLDERFLSRLILEIGMPADTDTLNDEIEEVFAQERERKSARPLRCGVTWKELDLAAAQWRLQQFNKRWGHSISAAQAGSPSREERMLDELDSAEEQRARAMRIAAEIWDKTAELMPIRPCLEPTCVNPATVRGRCREHATAKQREQRTVNNSFYASKSWRAARRAYLFDHPLCQYELPNGEECGLIADSVHHRQPIEEGGARRAPTNLMAICRSHHSTIHAQRNGRKVAVAS